jgi:hypothetical protein
MNSFFVENGQQPVFENSGYRDTIGTATSTSGFSVSGGYSQAGSAFSRASLAETEQPMSPASAAAPTRPSREMRPRVSKSASRTSALSVSYFCLFVGSDLDVLTTHVWVGWRSGAHRVGEYQTAPYMSTCRRSLDVHVERLDPLPPG